VWRTNAWPSQQKERKGGYRGESDARASPLPPTYAMRDLRRCDLLPHSRNQGRERLRRNHAGNAAIDPCEKHATLIQCGSTGSTILQVACESPVHTHLGVRNLRRSRRSASCVRVNKQRRYVYRERRFR
jgi:hypothetical protein